MNKHFFSLLVFIILSNCSLDTKTGIWKDPLPKKKNNALENVFKKTKIISKELNSNIKIKLKDTFSKNSFFNNQSNNIGYINYDGSLDKLAHFKFSKIDNYDFIEKEIHFTSDNSIIFSENKGGIIKLNKTELKRLWKKNHYSKNEKKMDPNLFFSSFGESLVVADSISNYYLVNLKNGDLIWKKNNSSPFNSQIKIFKDRFFVVDLENVLRCYSIKNGNEIWNFKSESSYINSQNKLSLIIHENKIIFINSLGDITALNLNNGRLLWQTPTQTNSIIEDAFSLKNSELVLNNKNIYFSNNKNQLFSINSKNGIINWKQFINSGLRPTIIGNLIFAISEEGFLIILDSSNGNIIRITELIFDNKNFTNLKLKPKSFFVGKNNIYLNVNDGRILKIKISDGKASEKVKIDSNKISQSYVSNKNIYLLKENALLKLN